MARCPAASWKWCGGSPPAGVAWGAGVVHVARGTCLGSGGSAARPRAPLPLSNAPPWPRRPHCALLPAAAGRPNPRQAAANFKHELSAFRGSFRFSEYDPMLASAANPVTKVCAGSFKGALGPRPSVHALSAGAAPFRPPRCGAQASALAFARHQHNAACWAAGAERGWTLHHARPGLGRPVAGGEGGAAQAGAPADGRGDGGARRHHVRGGKAGGRGAGAAAR